MVRYLEWLGSRFTDSTDRRDRLLAAGKAMSDQEAYLVDLMLNGDAQHRGLVDLPSVYVIGGHENAAREGLVSLSVEGVPSADVVRRLNDAGVRTHVRKNDYFSGNILNPLGMDTCVRVSLCHYNSPAEVIKFLNIMDDITGAPSGSG